MKKRIIVVMAICAIVVSKKMYADPETGGKTHTCIWIYITPQQAVVSCDGAGTFCATGSDCVKN